MELLNEYLQEEDDQAKIKTLEITKEEVSILLTQKAGNEKSPLLVNNPGISSSQGELLELFAKSSFVILQNEVETFARSKGLFKNQLIESINDAYYETLDDVLIEEENEHFIINEHYYQKIFTT